MPIWQNFKDSDHTVEKNIFRGILSIALCVCLFFLIDKASENVPVIVLTIIVLVTVPGLIAFLVSRHIRKQQIKQEEDDKIAMGEDYYSSGPNTYCIDRK